MKNKLLEELKTGAPLVGTFFESGSPVVMECVGLSGLDFVIIDTEHGPGSPDSTVELIRAAELKGLAPLVRVADTSRASILKMLDIGALGLIIPYVETQAQIAEIVRWGKYTPLGQRGFFMGRGAEYGFAAHAQSLEYYFETCNTQTMLLPQCETVGCLSHIEQITATSGVDGIFVGPYDLSIALGCPGQFGAPDFTTALARIQDACRAARKPCFIYAPDAKTANQRLREGFEGVAVGSEVVQLTTACQALYTQTVEGLLS